MAQRMQHSMPISCGPWSQPNLDHAHHAPDSATPFQTKRGSSSVETPETML